MEFDWIEQSDFSTNSGKLHILELTGFTTFEI